MVLRANSTIEESAVTSDAVRLHQIEPEHECSEQSRLVRATVRCIDPWGRRRILGRLDASYMLHCRKKQSSPRYQVVIRPIPPHEIALEHLPSVYRVSTEGAIGNAVMPSRS